MPIQVTCPGCLTRFQVNERFAGKKGPCPKCKAQIAIPEVQDEVVIHAPKDDGPKDSKGRAVLKPIRRQETKVTRRGVILTVASVLCALAAAIALRMMGDVPAVARVLGALVLAPPLVWAGYGFMRDSELEPFRGRELQIRVAICAALFSLLWALYAWIPPYVMDVSSVTNLSPTVAAISLAALLALGGLISVATFDFEFPTGLLHAGVYLVSTLLLALIAGIPLSGPLGG